MKKIHPSKIGYYARNKRVFLSNPRYKSMCRVKTKPTFTNAYFNALVKEECSKFIENNGEQIKKENPALYNSITGKKAKQAPLVLEKTNQEEVKEKTSYDELDEYQKRRDAERKAELERAREKLKKNEVKFNFVSQRKDWSIYGGWVNAHEPFYKCKLGYTQAWRVEKPTREYY
jgi:DNA repair exonuclease SbcCD nuclease subunit